MSFLVELEAKEKYLVETPTKSLEWLNNISGEGGDERIASNCPNNWGGRRQIKQAVFDLTGEWLDCPPMRGDGIGTKRTVWDVDIHRTRRLKYNRRSTRYYWVFTDQDSQGIWVERYTDGLYPTWIEITPSQMKD